MKALKILLVILVVLVVLAGGALLLLNRYVQSPSFKETALLAVQTAGGAKMQVTDLDVSLWRGVSLRGIAVANPPGYAGNLVQADAFVLRYRLLPLFQRRLEITQLELQKPVIALMRNADGAWNFEQLGGGAGDSGGGGSIHQAGLDISLQRLALTRGTVVVLGPDNKELLKLQDLQLTSNVELAGGALHGRGQ
ncbi:AsmA family protein, partial [bacterium]|nr:AsmA family protein [bacterium]